MKIYKYELWHTFNAIEMTGASKIVGIGLQNDLPVIWATFEQPAVVSIRHFIIVVTGEEFDASKATHLGVLQRSDGIVLHVLEIHQ